ncbi:MAG: hypothetical protein HYU51_04285 [Candidatus Rokubacteria bacterium]|nr:hypothetical protein [Candidatus Rokubacteria bacterium]
MKKPINVREQLETAKAKLKAYEGRVKELQRALASVERAMKSLEPRVRRAVEQTQVVARGVRAGIRAGAARYRGSRSK